MPTPAAPAPPAARLDADSPARLGWERGTKCERDLVRVFDETGIDPMPRDLLLDLLTSRGHVINTAHRAVKRLIDNGCLKRLRGHRFTLVSRALPWIKGNASRPGEAPNRFSATKVNPDREASYVRQFLAERLDLIFENPNCYLTDVLRAVEWAGRMAVAALGNDAAGLREAVERYRSEWHDKRKQVERPLTAARLMEALQVGLFPEEFMDDAEVSARIAAHTAEMKGARDREIAEAVAENERLTRENADREKRDEEPLELIDVSDDWLNCKTAAAGLVPTGGGERVGRMRLIGFLMKVGALPRDDPAPESSGAGAVNVTTPSAGGGGTATTTTGRTARSTPRGSP